MTNTPENPGMALIEHPLAPEIFADGVTGFVIVGNTVRLTLETVRANYSKNGAPPNRVVVGRLILPLERVEDIAKGLLNLVAQHKAQATSAPQGPATVN